MVVEARVAASLSQPRDGAARGAPRSQTAARAEAVLRAIPDMMFRMSRDGVYLDFKADLPDELFTPTERKKK